MGAQRTPELFMRVAASARARRLPRAARYSRNQAGDRAGRPVRAAPRHPGRRRSSALGPAGWPRPPGIQMRGGAATCGRPRWKANRAASTVMEVPRFGRPSDKRDTRHSPLAVIAAYSQQCCAAGSGRGDWRYMRAPGPGGKEAGHVTCTACKTSPRLPARRRGSAVIAQEFRRTSRRCRGVIQRLAGVAGGIGWLASWGGSCSGRQSSSRSHPGVRLSVARDHEHWAVRVHDDGIRHAAEER